MVVMWRYCLLGSIAATLALTNASYVSSPPTLEGESERKVWFHIPSSGPPQPFSLKCQASNRSPATYEWYKDGTPLVVDGLKIIWQRPGQSGTILFRRPHRNDEGDYQCRVINMYGTALSNIIKVKQGLFEHFENRPQKHVTVQEGEPLSLNCTPPMGIPPPTVFWLFRSTKQSHVIETINRKHITVDGEGNLQFSYTKQHDGRENLVYQCAATSPVLHGEYRAGNEFLLHVEPQRAMLRTPQKLWFSPEDVKVTAGDDLKLTCIFSGTPLPEVKWWRENENGEDVSLPTLRIDRKDYGKTLVVENIRTEDEGIYVCHAGSIRHRMSVSVKAAPYWVETKPKDTTIPEDGFATIHCDASGTPTPIIRWFINGLPLEDAPPNKRRFVLDNGRVLKVERVKSDVDTAVYQCNASNPLGYQFANAYINVLALPPRFLTEVNQTIKIVKGKDVDLDCSVEGAPEPRVEWVDSKDIKIKTRVPPYSNKEKYEFFANHSLRIKNLNLGDSTLYYCNVSNKFGLNRASRKLEVYEPTYFIVAMETKQKVVEAGDTVTLRCEGRADPRLRVSYNWIKDGEPVDFDKEKGHILKFGDSRLDLNKVRGRHSGTYLCNLTTVVDAISSQMKLIVKDVPEPPEVKEINCTGLHATIKWKESFDNYDPVTHYIVQTATAFHPDDWKVVLTERKKESADYEAIVPLSPWVNYTFRVVAVNSHGKSEYGTLLTPCRTRPSFPYTNPTNVSAEGDEKDNLVIFWQPMEKESWNADKFRYRISYALDRPGLRDEDFETFEVEDPKQDRVTIRDQPTFRRYQVKVRAINSIGPAVPDPDIIYGYSGESAPSMAPGNFTREVINATAVRFTWSHVTNASLNGHFLGYKIKSLRKPNTDRQKGWDSHYNQHQNGVPPKLVAPRQNKIVVNYYEPMQKYSAVVHAYNGRHESPPSNMVQLEMPEGLPSEVNDLEVRAVGSETILINWGKPSSILGRLRGYFLSFEPFHRTYPTLDKSKYYEAYVLRNKQHYVHQIAEAATKYRVSVWAKTGGGEGPKVFEDITTWPKSGVPGKPGVRQEALSGGRYRVEWVLPEEEMPGSGFFLNYTRGDSGEWDQTPYIQLPRRHVTLQTLEPGSRYTLILTASDGEPSKGRVSDSDPFYIQTELPGTNSHHVVTDTITSAAWFIAAVCAIVLAVVISLIICIIQRNRGGKYPVKKKEMERGTAIDQEEERTFMEYQYGPGYTKEDAPS